MKSGDVVTVALGIAIVILIAFVANPQNLADLRQASFGTTIPAAGTTPVIPAPVVPATGTLTQQFPATPSPRPTDSPAYRISYSPTPLKYPVYRIPENLLIFGASDVPLRNREMVTFATVEESRGGITNIFTVPYPVWVVNISVVSENNPQYGNFRMALCYANGTIVEGAEILNRGTAYHVIQVSNTPMYMIVSVSSIDRYRITLETPREYYSASKH